MRAAVFQGAGRISVEDLPDPVAGPRDIILDVRACGVCGSDLHAFRSGRGVPVGQVMGHEFAGVVCEVGRDVSGIAIGDRVTGLPIQPCGNCRRCRRRAPHLCEVWTTRSIAFGLPGAFARRLRIPDAVMGGNVHRLPEGLEVSGGALVEPLAVALHAVSRAGAGPGHTAVVFGLGPIGLQAGQALLAAGAAPVVGVDLSPLRRAAAERLGMPTVDATPGLEAVTGALADLLGGREVDLVVEASGVAALVAQACEIVRPGGTVVPVALYHSGAPFDPMVLVHKELTVRGSANVTPADFRTALELLASGRVRTEPLISHRLPLERIGDAFRTQLDPLSSVKVLVTEEF